MTIVKTPSTIAADALKALYPSYKTEKKDVGMFLENYVIDGGVATKDVTRNNVLNVTLITVSIGGNILNSSDTNFRTDQPSVTYFLDYRADGTYSFKTVHADGVYVPVAEVATDTHKNISTITDKADPRGGFRLDDAYPIPDLAALQAEVAPFFNKTIYASNYGFKNAAGDGAKLKALIEGESADILYIDTNILIDVGVRIDSSGIKEIAGLGGIINITNKGTSPTPYLEFEYCSHMVFSNLRFVGDFDKSLTSDSEYQNTIVSALYLSHCNDMKIMGCTVSGVIGASALHVRYCSNVFVKDNNVLNCWNHITGDLQGDGIYVGFSSNVNVISNYVKNVFPDKTKFGRVGITFEFADTMSCTCTNNYVYGYDRAIHVELIGGPVVVKSNIVEGCALGFVGWDNHNQHVLVEDNYFSNNGVPTDYVVQLLQGTRGFLSFFTSTVTEEVNANTIVKNNTFILIANVAGVEMFVFTKISGESYIGNTFIDTNLNKSLLIYNPNDVTINNNRLSFIGNKVTAGSIYFGHIGQHKINQNEFQVKKWTFICTPTPNTWFYTREFIGNRISHPSSGGIVDTDAYLFLNKVSLMCTGNIFVDIKLVSGQQNTVITANQNYSSTPALKFVCDDNTLISTQSDTISTFFYGRLDNMIYPSMRNRRIRTTGFIYEMSGMSNQALVVTQPDGTEKTILVDNSGVLSTSAAQKFK